MEDRRRKSQFNFYYNRYIQISHFKNNRQSDCCRFSVCCVQIFYTNYQRDRHSVTIFWGRILYSLDYLYNTPTKGSNITSMSCVVNVSVACFRGMFPWHVSVACFRYSFRGCNIRIANVIVIST